MNDIYSNQTDSVTSAQNQVKPSYKVHNWIALIYVILLAITFFNKNEVLASILALVMLYFGFVACISFIGRMFDVARGIQNFLAKVFIYLVGFGGGIVILNITTVVVLISVFRHPSLVF